MIIVSSTESKKIYIKGTTDEVSSVALRLGANLREDGKSMVVNIDKYKDVATYEANEYDTIPVVGFEDVKVFDLSNGDGTYKAQTMDVAHTEYKAYLESLGFTAVIEM